LIKVKKYFYFGKNSITIGTFYYPCIQIGLEFGEKITLKLGSFIQLYFSLNFYRLNSLLRKIKMNDRELSFDIGFSNGLTLRINLFADTMGWKKGDRKWCFFISDMIKGNHSVSKTIIEERDILIPMPEKSYQAHAILADWTWKYPRWFSKKVRRCEIDIPDGIPHAGKGENSYDCGDDATFGITTGRVKNIPIAVGNLVGSILNDRVRYGGWSDWNFQRKFENK
jgi:hypothetical protein